MEGHRDRSPGLKRPNNDEFIGGSSSKETDEKVTDNRDPTDV